jgi:hypothetical protein
LTKIGDKKRWKKKGKAVTIGMRWRGTIEVFLFSTYVELYHTSTIQWPCIF